MFRSTLAISVAALSRQHATGECRHVATPLHRGVSPTGRAATATKAAIATAAMTPARRRRRAPTRQGHRAAESGVSGGEGGGSGGAGGDDAGTCAAMTCSSSGVLTLVVTFDGADGRPNGPGGRMPRFRANSSR